MKKKKMTWQFKVLILLLIIVAIADFIFFHNLGEQHFGGYDEWARSRPQNHLLPQPEPEEVASHSTTEEDWMYINYTVPVPGKNISWKNVSAMEVSPYTLVSVWNWTSQSWGEPQGLVVNLTNDQVNDEGRTLVVRIKPVGLEEAMWWKEEYAIWWNETNETGTD